jgi:deoxyadenosine/deoxycytidine kinase
MTPDLQSKKEPPSAIHPLIGVVGPCAAGKTTLIAGLNQLGYHTRHIAQEHSYVPDMWQRLTKPDLLIFLDASYPVTCSRRKLDWTEAEFAEEQRRLIHARLHADLILKTDDMSVEQVLKRVIAFLQERFSSSMPRKA